MVSAVRDPGSPLSRMDLRFSLARRSLFSSTVLGSAAWGALLLALAFVLPLWHVSDALHVVDTPATDEHQFLPPPPMQAEGGAKPQAHKEGTITPVSTEVPPFPLEPNLWEQVTFDDHNDDVLSCCYDHTEVKHQPTPVLAADDPVGYVDEIPFATLRVEPEYPDLARTAGIEGVVRIEAVVGREGLVRSVRVLDPGSLFDEAAMTAARAWRFRPATVNGHPVTAKVGLTFRFTLH